MCMYVCARAWHMCACNCNVSVCHVFDCSSIFFSIANIKKKVHDFVQFSHFPTHILAVYQDAKQSTRQMCSPSCYD